MPAQSLGTERTSVGCLVACREGVSWKLCRVKMLAGISQQEKLVIWTIAYLIGYRHVFARCRCQLSLPLLPPCQPPSSLLPPDDVLDECSFGVEKPEVEVRKILASLSPCLRQMVEVQKVLASVSPIGCWLEEVQEVLASLSLWA